MHAGSGDNGSPLHKQQSPKQAPPLLLIGSEDWGPLCERLLGIVPVPGVDRKVSGMQNVDGAFILLQLWAWERFPFVAPGRLGMRERPPGSPLGAWQPPHGKEWKGGQKDYRQDHCAELEMWNNRLDHIIPTREADPHEYAYPADDPYVTWGKELEKWLRKRPPMAPNQPQAEGVNVVEQVDPLHELAIEVEDAAA
ncbi:hypothetical protein RHSIM_Rhsim03G0242200 [Rhododendron simsii]|uniref:Aminotransferase-like plant mobile domain-containing protein n=1 Tax=Rhododendron simsii TaxID=118357 RepID=A0A834LQL1_RHOSS|nr:hypothetical protein RHSIM_Rhsim03G0242200 [Rhododendron simsii]